MRQWAARSCFLYLASSLCVMCTWPLRCKRSLKKNEYRERLAGLDSDCQHLSDDHDWAQAGLVDHLVSDSVGEHRDVRDYLDGDRRGSRKTELVGDFDYCAGGELDCAWVFGLGGLIK